MANIHVNITGDNSNAVSAFNGLRRSVQSTMQDVNSAGDAIDNALSKVAKVAATVGVAFGAREFANNILQVRRQIESLEISFTTLLGSEAKANALLSEIKEFAISTPMQMGDLAQGAKTMLGFGIELDNIMPKLKQIGDISQGDSAKFQSLTLAFSQATATGKLMGQDLLQMVNAGFNPLTEMAKTTGKSIAELKEDMSNGAISAEMLSQAFESATAEGGRFYNALEDQSKSINGALSNLQGAWDDMLNAIGEKSQGVFVEAITLTTDIVKSYEKYLGVLAGLVTAYGAFKTVLMAGLVVEKTANAIKAESAVVTAAAAASQTTLTATEVRATAVKNLLTAATLKLNAALLMNPYVLLAAAIAAVVAGLVAWAACAKDVSKAQQDLKQEAEDYANAIEDEKKKIAELDAIVRDETKSEEERNEALQKLKDIQDKYGKGIHKAYEGINTYKDYVAKATEIQKAYNEELERTNRLHKIDEYKDKANILDKLREYQKYNEIAKKSTGAKKVSAESSRSAIWGLLDKKLQDQIREDGIDKTIKAYQDTANQYAGDARAKINAEWNTKWLKEGIDAKKLEKELKAQQKYLDAANKANKNWVIIDGIPIAKSDLENRINEGYAIIEKSKEQAVKNYAYWHKIREDAENERKKLDPDSKKTKKRWDELTKTIADAEKHLKPYGKDNSSSKAQDGAARLAKQKAEYLRMQKEQNEKIKRDEIDAQHATRQAVINAMADGNQKTLDQINLDYDKQKEAVKRWYEDLLKAKIEGARKLWEQDPNNAKKVWNDSLVNVTYTQQEKDEKAAKDEEIEFTHSEALKKFYKDSEQYMLDYLKEYGTIEEQRLAITKDYEQQILEAKDDYAKLALKKQRDAAIKALNFEDFKDKINWEGIFGNLQNATKKQLDAMKEQIVAYMESDEYKNALPENKQALIEGLNNIKDAFDAKNDAIASYFQNRKSIKEAEDTLRQADLSLTTAKANMKIVQGEQKAGRKTSKDVDKAREEVKQAQRNRNQAQNDLDTKQLNAQQKLVNALNQLNDNIQSLGDLSKVLGIDPESSEGKTIAGVADVANNAMGAYADFMSGNYVGALTKGIKALDGAVALFDGGNLEQMNAEIERLGRANETLAGAIDDLKESIDKGAVSDVAKTYEEALELLRKQEQNSTNAMLKAASAWSHGGHSVAYEYNRSADSYNRQRVRQAGQIVGKDISTLQDFLSLSADELKKIRKENAELFNTILEGIRSAENGHNKEGIADMITQFMDEYGGAEEKLLEQALDRLTNTSLDSIKNDFRGLLGDMESGMSEATDSFEDMLRNAVINGLASDVYDKELKEFRDKFAEAMEEGNLSKEEVDALRNEYNDIMERALKERTEKLKELGLDGYSASQQSSTKGVKSMTQDTAEELNGRFTALQISNESINQNMANAVSRLLELSSLSQQGNQILNSILIQTTLIGTNLASLLDLHKKQKNEFGELLTSIDKNTKKI